jgi:RimJ/RimL family protein N-acetyltransferase
VTWLLLGDDGCVQLDQRDLSVRAATPEDVRVLQSLVTRTPADRWTAVMYDGGRRHVDDARPQAGQEVLAVRRHDRIVGLVELRHARPGAPVELSWWIDPAERSRHTASRIAGLVVEELRRQGATRIEAHLNTLNHRSRWVAASAGLRFEATLRQAWEDDARPGARLDVEVWCLLAGEAPLEPQPELSAGSLHLRPLRPSDADAVATAGQDPLSQHWLPGLHTPRTEDTARDFVGNTLRTWGAGTDAVWGFCDTVTSELLGCVGLHGRRADPGWRELGWHCFPWARGRGATAQAVGAVARWGRGSLGLTRIDAHIEPGNTASIRVAQKAGFSYEATLASSVTLRDATTGPAQIWWWP